MSARHALLGVAAAALVATGAWDASAQSGPPNYSSHGASFFEDLLRDRIWLYERPNAAEARDRGLVWGVHHAADGTAMACIRLDGTWQVRTGRWRVVPSPRFRALYNYQEAGTEPDPGHVEGHVPVFYDPGTGRLHSESAGERGWFVLSLGWVQESWPLALKEACAGLDLPAGLPVNERQTSVLMEEAVAQDPAAALRTGPGRSYGPGSSPALGRSPVPGNAPVPGSELRAPGSTGLGLAAGAPTVTGDELARFLLANDGFVLESPAGVRVVLALGPERDELWRLDAGDDVSDTAVLLPTADGTGIAVQWERLPRRQDYRVGDPFPLLPTGERYAAHLLLDRLIEADRPVALPLGEPGELSVRFASDGTLRAAAVDGSVSGGRWRWSRGDLHVALDGAPETSAYPWRALAALVPGLPDVQPNGAADGGQAERTR